MKLNLGKDPRQELFAYIDDESGKGKKGKTFGLQQYDQTILATNLSNKLKTKSNNNNNIQHNIITTIARTTLLLIITAIILIPYIVTLVNIFL